jgi:hypothetical protein
LAPIFFEMRRDRQLTQSQCRKQLRTIYGNELASLPSLSVVLRDRLYIQPCTMGFCAFCRERLDFRARVQ